ncbi:MAG: ABC transporter permease [Christensenellales bacterium]
MKKNQFLNKSGPPILTVILILGIWEGAVALFHIPGYLLPPPSGVFRSLIEDFPMFLPHLFITVKETLLGVLFAIALGVLFAVLMHVWKPLDRAISPLLVASQTIPILAIAPLLVVYLGFGLLPKVFTVVLMCFFPVTVSLKDALKQMDYGYVLMLKSMGASRWDIIREAELPFAAAGFLSGLKVSLTYAVTGAIVGEWLGSDGGLGYLLLRAKNGYMLDRVFAIILLIVLTSLLLFLATGLVERILLPHKRAEQQDRGEI